MKRKFCVDCNKQFRVKNESVYRCRKCANKDSNGMSDGMFNKPNHSKSNRVK